MKENGPLRKSDHWNFKQQLVFFICAEISKHDRYNSYCILLRKLLLMYLSPFIKFITRDRQKLAADHSPLRWFCKWLKIEHLYLPIGYHTLQDSQFIMRTFFQKKIKFEFMTCYTYLTYITACFVTKRYILKYHTY